MRSEQLLDDLTRLVQDAGRSGGMVSVSVYDTAQVLRLAPGEQPATLEWLRSQQRSDGGWGHGDPLARDASTLAAVLAIHAEDRHRCARGEMAAGLRFLRAHAEQWSGVMVERFPLAAELVLPSLLDEAVRRGLPIDRAPYERLYGLGARKRAALRTLAPREGDAVLHSWEAWSEETSFVPSPGRLGIGMSPAATSAWLARHGHDPARAEESAAARRYLTRACAATAGGIAGAMPPVWPIDVYELAFIPYVLLLAGILDHSAFKPALDRVARALETGLTSDGIGAATGFEPDSDDTAAVVCVLAALGRDPAADCLRRFERGALFACFMQELNPSVVGSARCVHALHLTGRPVDHHQVALAELQLSDGSWQIDKWHRSPHYTTLHLVAALTEQRFRRALERAVAGVLGSQHRSGGWGAAGTVNPTETAYAMLTLVVAVRALGMSDPVHWALRGGQSYLRSRLCPFANHGGGPRLWVEKEDYGVPRVDAAFERAALLAADRLLARGDAAARRRDTRRAGTAEPVTSAV